MLSASPSKFPDGAGFEPVRVCFFFVTARVVQLVGFLVVVLFFGAGCYLGAFLLACLFKIYDDLANSLAS